MRDTPFEEPIWAQFTNEIGLRFLDLDTSQETCGSLAAMPLAKEKRSQN